MQRQTLAQMADSLTVVPATDPESLIPLVDSVTAPYGHGPVTNIQHRAQQESHPPVSHVTSLLTSDLAMDALILVDAEMFTEANVLKGPRK